MIKKNGLTGTGLIRAGVYVLLVLLMVVCSLCSSLRDRARNKITFDIDAIDENGLIGPADGKRSVAYEFCIPRDSIKQKEIQQIDTSVKFLKGSSGRIGCGREQYLCIGEGATRTVLLKLAALDYIKRIDPFYGE